MRKLSRLRPRLGQVLFCCLVFFLGRLSTHLNSSVIFQGREEVFLYVIVVSAYSNTVQRNAIRQTWKSYGSHPTVKVVFSIGVKGLSEQQVEVIQAEEAENMDLLFLPSYDGYGALTGKVAESFFAAHTNSKFKYLLKVDDDSFVNLPVVVEELQNSNYLNGLYWGFFDGRAPVFKQGKWAEKDYVLCDKYIPYALGGGYVLSSDLVKFISDNKDELVFYRSEDASVGTWLSSIKVNRVHDVRFDTEWRSRGCLNSHIVSHKQSPEKMRNKHRALETTNHRVLCDKENELMKPYEYDWKAPPSKCCQRK